MTSKLRNPHYLPEVINLVTLVNFALTLDGLSDQLLGMVIAKERSDLEETRQKLIVQSAANEAGLKEIEDSILITISAAGNILEDEHAIDILANSIKEKQESAKVTARNIDTFRESYQPVACNCAVLYYCISDLPNVDPMYQYSLQWFLNIFKVSLETSKQSREIQKRMDFIESLFTTNLYSNVCRSLFEKDKLLFSFILCSKIMMSKNKLNTNEFRFFLTGGVAFENKLENPAASWLSQKSWDEICRIGELPAFKGTILVCVTKFIKTNMGLHFISPPAFNIASSYQDSDCVTPLIFILSPGADPMSALLNFAAKMDKQLNSISLGQGQGPIARGFIEQGQEDGSWVCLQNCHLAVSWMPVLEKLWEEMDQNNTNPSFRLWITSYPSDKFPTSILQSGVKMTNEPPTGLQQNLLRSYQSDPVKEPEFYEGCPGKEKEFVKLLYGLCFFHAVVQERRKFGPIGWNIPYGFNESDFQISVQQLQMFINEQPTVPFDAITYLTGECNYGGRVTDDWDRRALNTILASFINKSVITATKYLFCELGAEYGLPQELSYDKYVEHIKVII
ncbi:Dynein heavy chain 7 [Blattella germanica]|nr:Dynein heavy chain 7 [Blattella germanica]